MSVTKLHAGEQRCARLLDSLESVIKREAEGLSIPSILGVCELLKDLVKGMLSHE
jgi:hypothetical protein